MDAQSLIERLMRIIERRISQLEKKKSLTEFDCRTIGEYLKILLAVKKNDENIEEELKKLISKLPDDVLFKMETK